MLLLLSHLLAFSLLFIESLFDLHSQDVPDIFAWIGIGGGLLLHGLYSWNTGDFTAISWSLTIGTIFSGYGWWAYYQGYWGGADAFAMGILGFAAPTALNGSNGLHIMDLIFNVLIAALIITVVFSIYKFYKSDISLSEFKTSIIQSEENISFLIILSGFVGLLASFAGLNGLFYFLVGVFFVFMYYFFKFIEDYVMVHEVKVEDLEGGEVPAPNQGLGDKIKGLEIEEVKELDIETLKVREGVPFIPVFLIALVLTDLNVTGIQLMFGLFG